MLVKVRDDMFSCYNATDTSMNMASARIAVDMYKKENGATIANLHNWYHMFLSYTALTSASVTPRSP
jgi:hypothetical protein